MTWATSELAHRAWAHTQAMTWFDATMGRGNSVRIVLGVGFAFAVVPGAAFGVGNDHG